MNARVLRQAITAGLACLGVVLALGWAQPASAAPTTRTCIGTSASGVIACFEAYGDHFYIRDTKSDGIQPGVEWDTDYQRIGLCWFDRGHNPTDCNYNLAEGHRINFRVLMRDAQTGEILTESSEAHATI